MKYFLKTKYHSGWITEIDDQPIRYTGCYEEIIPAILSSGSQLDGRLIPNRPHGISAKLAQLPQKLATLKKGDKTQLAEPRWNGSVDVLCTK